MTLQGRITYPNPKGEVRKIIYSNIPFLDPWRCDRSPGIWCFDLYCFNISKDWEKIHSSHKNHPRRPANYHPISKSWGLSSSWGSSGRALDGAWGGAGCREGSGRCGAVDRFLKRRGGVEDWRWIAGAKGGAKEVPVRQRRFCCHPRDWNVWGGRGAFRSLRSPGHCMGSGRGGGIAGTGEVADGAEAMAVWFDHFLGEISKVWSFSCSESFMGSRVYWILRSD